MTLHYGYKYNIQFWKKNVREISQTCSVKSCNLVSRFGMSRIGVDCTEGLSEFVSLSGVEAGGRNVRRCDLAHVEQVLVQRHEMHLNGNIKR